MTTRREFVQALPAIGTAFAVAGHVVLEDSPARAQGAAGPLQGHFHPKGKAPSQFTLDTLRKAREGLPFSDTRDFEEQKRGLIAPMPDLKIMADAGHVAWDMERFRFLDKQDEFDSIHPSLVRQSKLNKQLRALRGHSGYLSSPRLRSVRHLVRQRQDRVDRLRSSGDRGTCPRGLEAVSAARRRGPASLCHHLFAHPWRSLGRCARHRR